MSEQTEGHVSGYDDLPADDWDDDDLIEASKLHPPVPGLADDGEPAGLSEADQQHDQDDYDEDEADRQIAAVDGEGEDA